MTRASIGSLLVMLALAGGGCSKKEEPAKSPAPAAVATDALQSSGPAASAQGATGQTCEQCRERYCSKYEEGEIDVAKGCLVTPDPKHVPNADPNFIRDCKAVMDCAYKTKCAYDPARGPAPCYCGSIRPEACVESGPAADAPCIAEWKAATRSDENAVIVKRFSDLAYPAGWAFHLLECDRDQCGGHLPSRGKCVP